MNRALLAASVLVLSAGAAFAQPAPPQPLTLPPAIAAPRDTPYPGVITLSVDATDTDRRIVRVRETIPVAQPGPMTLLFPAWIPGKHAPRGMIEKLAGLTITGNGAPLKWTRDPLNVFAFHIDVPAGVKAVELSFQHVSPTDEDQGRVTVTPEMTHVQWFSLALYPAGHFARQIQIAPEIRLPQGWSYATALEDLAKAGDTARFKTVSFDVLVDSPLYAGRYVKNLDLDPGGRSRVTLNLVADEAKLLEVKPAHLAAHRAMVVQADRLFGARHFDHYDFLVALSDKLGGIGVEHQRSTEIGTAPRFFLDWDKLAAVRGVVPHEYVHSWNGKYRRPADQWTADFNTPMRNSLLWVYEGQTQYWGNVLAARSGMSSKQEALDAMAAMAAAYDNRVGRGWRAMQDTVHDPIISARQPQAWNSWQRSEDYYSEGQLIWLDADTLIREQTKGRKSLDDFARAFFGVNDGAWKDPLTYDFDEVVKTLNAVHPHDWAAFLRQRLDGHGPGAPLDGVTRGGYRLVYSATPTDYTKTEEARRRITDLTYSLGLVLNKDGEFVSVQWEGPAFKAGLADGVKLIAVNGVAYDGDRLKEAVTAAKGGKAPIELLVKAGERYRTVPIAYHDGLRYPRFERIAGTPARLDDILAARR
ncbi:M61 family metallopeptidase [Phenylobacterium sp.]|uniref:M61 family metallopeptidase n=1 Tax=Phenylobacterium sp. TaxID=1871053 RepID=UPI0027328036|nr:peptidase M61 [Phenylobacterium sp.]MDP3633597.1 peptidase M61 [Phenylobacterium sp.]